MARAASSLPVPLSPSIKNRFLARGHFVDQPKDAVHRVRLAENFGSDRPRSSTALSWRFSLASRESLTCLLDENFEFGQWERLREIVIGAELHRLDGRVDRTLGGQ